ncbi:cadherin repeat domain-containing protein [Cognaticolwellia mytili]|uniref:cadherin repeat domain-containing protein n=1 Tax=Cognaticolwellia mytili TaxID=1888913 RepID=UPI00117D2373|nr:cadherin repeat domain-containing protein [Cognaticolwellia mytili]
MKYLLTFFYFMLSFLLVACGGSGGNEPTAITPNNAPLSEIVDHDNMPNTVSDLVTINNTSVGITAYASDPEEQVKYKLLDSAEGRFDIHETSGVVYVADHLLLNANLNPFHSINIQATSTDGSLQTRVFTITVTTENSPIGMLVDINTLPNEVLEGGSNKTGITAHAVDPDDRVTYKLLENSSGMFQVDNGSGEVTVTDNRSVNARTQLVHEVEVEANSTDGSASKKKFNIDVLHNYDNNISNVSEYKTLLDWDNGSQQALDGWSWSDDIVYGLPGWLLNADGPLNGGSDYRWGWGARSFNKGDYGKENSAIITTVDISPSSNSGGSLQVFETEGSTDHRSTWWVWYDGKPLSERDITYAKTDRMSFYLKTEGMNALKDDGGKESIGNNFHIGTYLCWQTGEAAYGTGDGCPYEGEGNQHYYHYLAINSGAWIHVLLDQHPQHIRDGNSTLKNNPTWDNYQKNYFEQLSQFYFEIRNKEDIKTSFNVDELRYFSSEDMVETEQNDESITSLWVGYWKDKGVWEIGFHDESYQIYNDDYNSTFEIRWSVSPITNANFAQAELIDPMFYNGIEHAGKDAEHLIRRSNGWSSNVWTRFKLPDEVENNYVKVFFAVKDVSIKGEHIGTKWPYNKGDGHDAPTANIKIIDYYLQAPNP